MCIIFWGKILCVLNCLSLYNNDIYYKFVAFEQIHNYASKYVDKIQILSQYPNQVTQYSDRLDNQSEFDDIGSSEGKKNI